MRDQASPEQLAWERACFEQTRDRVRRISESAQHWGYVLGEPRLEGSYPDTKIVLVWKDREGDHEEDALLWDPMWREPNGARLHPEIVAVLMTNEFEEPA
jgi:hypothetical protein